MQTLANQGCVNCLAPNLPRYMRIYGPAKRVYVTSRAWPVTTVMDMYHISQISGIICEIPAKIHLDRRASHR